MNTSSFEPGDRILYTCDENSEVMDVKTGRKYSLARSKDGHPGMLVTWMSPSFATISVDSLPNVIFKAHKNHLKKIKSTNAGINGEALAESFKKMARAALKTMDPNSVTDIAEVDFATGENETFDAKGAPVTLERTQYYNDLAEKRRVACAQWARGRIRDLGNCRCGAMVGVNAIYGNGIKKDLWIVTECAKSHPGEVLMTGIDPRQFKVKV